MENGQTLKREIMGKVQSAEQGIFQSVEQGAMYDIHKEQSKKANSVIEQARKERGNRFDERYWSRTSWHYQQAYWYYSVTHYINDKFIGVESLATPESRKLNRELGLHKINK